MKKMKIFAVLTALVMLLFGVMSCDILKDESENSDTGSLTARNYLPDDFKNKTVKDWFIDNEEAGAFIFFKDNTWVDTYVYEGVGYPILKGTYTSSEITVTHIDQEDIGWDDYGTDAAVRPYTISGNTLTIQLIGTTQVYPKKK